MAVTPLALTILALPTRLIPVLIPINMVQLAIRQVLADTALDSMVRPLVADSQAAMVLTVLMEPRED